MNTEQQSTDALWAEIKRLTDELNRVTTLINTPGTEDFLDAVRNEAAHQRERWGTDHDAGKTDADWFWLVGYLTGKALHPGINQEKKLHRVIAAAAALFNWHRHCTGVATQMRPGIEPPPGES